MSTRLGVEFVAFRSNLLVVGITQIAELEATAHYKHTDVSKYSEFQTPG